MKILIIGDAGRGKTTLAKILSKKINVPFYSTDDFYWKKKYSVPNNKEKSITKISSLYKKNSWIVEGTTRHLLKPGFDFADKIIYLKHRTLVGQLFFFILRVVKRRDSFKEIMRHSFYLLKRRYALFSKKARNFESALKPYKNKILVLNSFKKIDSFIKDFV